MLPLHCKFHPSYWFASTQSVVGIASCLILLHYLPAPYSYLGVLLISATTLYMILHHALLRLPWSWVAIRIDAQHRVRLQQRNGHWLPMKILYSNTALPALMVLHIKPTISQRWRYPQSLVLLADSMPTDERRKLMVWLRWGRAYREDS